MCEGPGTCRPSLNVSTLASQFHDSIGLKYRNEETHSIRAVRLNDGVLDPPEGGWADRVYLAVINEGRKKLKCNYLMKKLKRNAII